MGKKELTSAANSYTNFVCSFWMLLPMNLIYSCWRGMNGIYYTRHEMLTAMIATCLSQEITVRAVQIRCEHYLTFSIEIGPLVFDAIRSVHEDTPIIILGGHAHVRDCGEF